ncbi:MAG: class I SAM-dependent methyltransferase [Bacteroidetes bacterium]|nr:class I SAM-dependent methyltransferase [Bacteroidota bacterium]
MKRCYEVAPVRVQQFLEAEIGFVLQKIQLSDKILDLGCGYGRVTIRLVKKAKQVTGIDISPDNIQLAKEIFKNEGIQFYEMNAIDLSFEDDQFDITICVQNGISAFRVDPEKLVQEALRVTKKEGKLLFSSYSEKFWEERLKWFQIQAALGLIGEIDYNLTNNGTIICKDGFKAITYSGHEFLKLASNFNVDARIYEIDNSSVFCEMIKK